MKADYGLKDTDVKPGMEKKLRRLVGKLIRNRISYSPFGVRATTEYNLRLKIRKLFTEEISFENYVGALEEGVIGGKES